MRLLIIGLNFAPELTGVGKYTGEMAAWFAAGGHDVSVITSRPYYPDWRSAKGLGRFAWRSEMRGSCRVIRCPIYVPQRITGVRRLLHLSSFAASSIPAAIVQFGQRFDVVAGIVPTLLTAPVALAVGRLLNAKTWLHVQDLEFDAAAELGIISNGPIVRAGLGLERRIMKGFDLVTAVSPKMLTSIEGKGILPSCLTLFPNWVDTSSVHPVRTSDHLRATFNIPADACIAFYAGSMGRKQNLQTVVAAARILDRTPGPKLVFVLAGAGPVRQELERAAAELSNVRLSPLIPDDQFNAVLNMADIHLLPQRRDISDLVMPSKLGPMLAVGKPVIATVPDNSQIAQMIGRAGVIVPPENAEALAAALYDLAVSPQRRELMGRIALEIARKEYAAESILSSIEARLFDLTGTACPVPGVIGERAA